MTYSVHVHTYIHMHCAIQLNGPYIHTYMYSIIVVSDKPVIPGQMCQACYVCTV